MNAEVFAALPVALASAMLLDAQAEVSYQFAQAVHFVLEAQ